jgi:hypothetical protein
MCTIKIHLTSGNFSILHFESEAQKNIYIDYLFLCNSKLIKLIEDVII